ncbi:YbaB/EbfC family nucleoid-associated protein [Nocardioides terrigena]|uniref:YbaB/EbfC family nucleoid-associated protein n=1 Tax=Nocardioides terrigena TaxID=424797 RepID=UPI000D3199FD|nr:YbaB/EbfC family nucleoid-associated protein [Nocardioides terrigena]
MDTDDWSARLRQDTTRRLEAVSRMQDELAQVHGEAAAAGGLVRVRVGPTGLPTELHLAPDAMRLSADQLARHVVAAITEAAASAGERVREVVGELVPGVDLEALLSGPVVAADREAVDEELDRWRSAGP